MSNLSYILKIIEHIVCNQLVEYTAKSSNVKQFQLAYRKRHSAEAMLLKVKTDFLNAIDNRKVVCLVLLDLSTAFDMVNHSLLLNRLKCRFRVDGTMLNWLHHYLTDRSQKVVTMQAKAMQNQIISHYHTVFHRDQSWDQSFSLFISCLWPIYVENTMLSTMGMLMITRST